MALYLKVKGLSFVSHTLNRHYANLLLVDKTTTINTRYTHNIITGFAPDQAHLSSGKGGEENECIYSNTPCNSTSKNGEGQHGKTFSNTCAGVIVSTNVVVLIITALISIATVYIIKKKCRRNNAAEEVRVQEGRGQEANNEGRPLIEGDDHAPGGEHGAIN